jgi:hypothetical protein
MTHSEFNHILGSIKALSPEQMRQLRQQLDSELASAETSQPAASQAAAPAQKPVWERILERSAAIPAEELDKLPTDLAEQHDHYLYGTPKRPTR